MLSDNRGAVRLAPAPRDVRASESTLAEDSDVASETDHGGVGMDPGADPSGGTRGATLRPAPAPTLAPAEEAIARGDYREALARCARDHGTGLGRLCMALTGSQAEADELVQEVLLQAYDGFSSFRAEGSLRAWLFGIARRVCARHVETRSRHTAKLRLVHDASRDAVGVDGEAGALVRERAERTRAALATLRPSEREPLLLRYESDLSFRDVAAACGIDEPTARKRVSRAIAKLRESLSEEMTDGRK